MSGKISTLSKWSMLLGNLFEHYDTNLFYLLSPFLAPLFFPGKDPLTALILTYCIIPIGMIARPFGSLFFGYIGDTRGRKPALVLSLSGMAIVTAGMAFMPTYNQVGFFAPILLSLGRILQNFFAAGETIGGAIYLVENAPESEKDFTSGFYNASTIAGILLASLGVSVICALDAVHDCWRFLYLFGCSTAVFAVMLRMKVSLNSTLHNISLASSIKFVLKTCWSRRQAIMTIAVASGFSYSCYTIALIMMNALVPLVTTTSSAQMMHLNTILLAVDFMLLPLFGILAKRFSRAKMMIISSALATITGYPLFWLLPGASLTLVIIIRLFLVVLGVWFSAPFHSWSQQLVPPSQRYTVISFAYAIGSQLLGGPIAVISLWLFQKTNWIVSAGWYWMVLGLAASYLIYKQEAYAAEPEEKSVKFQES